ncbi:integrase core domain-containing protein [Pedobacter jamesrossensis]|uniref:Integrase core domain-containing protein n=1 Tax=Pedobacter jamesrossensis TaxID=1908238 RepID=A0ABV8NIH4_9SPHI
MIKNDFFPKKTYQNHKDAQKSLMTIIDNYNLRRPHSSIDYLILNDAHTLGE